MKILVFGLGALGTVYSCLLKENGHEVTGVDRKAVVKGVNTEGVKVSGIWGDHEARLDKAVDKLKDIKGKDFDLIIVSVKSYETAEVARQLQPVMGENTYLMLAQNGYGNFEAASQYIASDKIILGRVIFGAETLAAGVSKVTVIADDVILGSPINTIKDSVLSEFARIFNEAGIPTRVSKEIMKYIWGKIIYNSALNSMGAVKGVTYGELAANEKYRQVMDRVIKEIFAVLKAMDQEMFWTDAEAYIEDFYAKLLPSTASHHASMLQDMQRGRKTEIDALNGAVVELGEKYGIETPANEMMTKLVKEKEAEFLKN